MLISIKVKPNSKEFKIEKIDESNWIVHVRSEPEKNKANIEIIKEISKIYGNCKIVKGLKSKKKVIEIIQ